MKKLSEKQQKIADWDNELRFDSANYTDVQIVDIAQKTIDFACENFKAEELAYEGYQHEYEVMICNVALGIDSHLQKNLKNKKSPHIKKFVIDVINSEKYGRGRNGFIFLLYILKMDEVLRTIATERKDFWETPRINFQLVYSLFRRKIQGFSNEAEMLIANNPKDTELKKYAKKYLEKNAVSS